VAALGEPAIQWYPTSHMGFLTHLPAALTAMRAFIDRGAAAPTRPQRRMRKASSSPA